MIIGGGANSIAMVAAANGILCPNFGRVLKRKMSSLDPTSQGLGFEGSSLSHESDSMKGEGRQGET